jgi:hypothetical protein
MNKKIILCFDNWLKGVNNFERFAALLNEEEFLVVLIHSEKWFNYQETLLDYQSLNLKIFDICDLNSRDPMEIIKFFKPSLIFLTQNNTFYNKSVIMASRLMSVPTIFLAHGLMTTSLSGEVFSRKNSILFKINNLYNRVRKNRLLSEFFWYITVHKRVGWSNLFKMLIDLRNRLLNDSYISDDSKTSYCLVYTKADRIFLSKYLGVNLNLIKVIGIPELDYMSGTNLKLNQIITASSNIKKYGIYIESKALYKKFSRNTEKFLDYLKNLQRRYRAHGFDLIFDFHPNTIEDLGDNINCLGNNVILKNDPLLYNDACFYLCDPTTKATLATYFSKPILLNLELFDERTFAHFFKEYPLVFTSFDDLIKSEQVNRFRGATCNETRAMIRWKDLYISSFNDGLSVGERIRRNIQQFISC